MFQYLFFIFWSVIFGWTGVILSTMLVFTRTYNQSWLLAIMLCMSGFLISMWRVRVLDRELRAKS